MKDNFFDIYLTLWQAIKVLEASLAIIPFLWACAESFSRGRCILFYSFLLKSVKLSSQKLYNYIQIESQTMVF